MLAEAVVRLLASLRPDALGVELVLAAAVAALLLSIALVLRACAPAVAADGHRADGFAELRVLLRASDPDAPGHRRSRAPTPVD